MAQGLRTMISLNLFKDFNQSWPNITKYLVMFIIFFFCNIGEIENAFNNLIHYFPVKMYVIYVDISPNGSNIGGRVVQLKPCRKKRQNYFTEYFCTGYLRNHCTIY